MLKFAHLPAIGQTTLAEALEDLNWRLSILAMRPAASGPPFNQLAPRQTLFTFSDKNN
jgi:hypothetical protein